MFDRINYMDDSHVYFGIKEGAEIKTNLLSAHVVISDSEKHVLGEIVEINSKEAKARLLGEFENGKLRSGVIRKPLLDATIRTIMQEEIPLILGQNNNESLLLGGSPFYNQFPVYLNVNDFFSNHFAIFGNSGSGKSCGTTRLFQNMFHDQRLNPYKANIFIFDSPCVMSYDKGKGRNKKESINMKKVL